MENTQNKGRCWKHSSAVPELQADDWQLPLPTLAELFWSRWSLLGVEDRVLPIPYILQRPHFPQRYKQCSSGHAVSAARTPMLRCRSAGSAAMAQAMQRAQPGPPR